MNHAPFTLDQWWDRERGCYCCKLCLGKIEVTTKDTSVYGSPVSAESLAWREMALKLAQAGGRDQQNSNS